ncbi:MAG TPA: hypothetical protein H9836_08870, partial [Candidatus Nocardiopsis merdipullorum]|nr:hypothetical protein [Candidatus Nocardiopsis merdipullorum]
MSEGFTFFLVVIDDLGDRIQQIRAQVGVLLSTTPSWGNPGPLLQQGPQQGVERALRIGVEDFPMLLGARGQL